MCQISAIVNADDTFAQSLIDQDELETATVTRQGLRAALDACDLPVK